MSNLTDRLAEIEKRWSQPDIPERLFSGHVKPEIDFLLSTVKRLVEALTRVTETYHADTCGMMLTSAPCSCHVGIARESLAKIEGKD